MNHRDWGDLAQRYAMIRSSLDDDDERILALTIQYRISRITDQDAQWLAQALGDATSKWFAAFVCGLFTSLPESLLLPLLTAAITERNPSRNRAFIEPLVTAFGNRRVMHRLLDLVEHGTNAEKAGAINALYWASVRLERIALLPSDAQHSTTAESQAAYAAVADLNQRRKALFVQEFVANPDLQVRRNLIAWLDFDPAAYPSAVQSLVQTALIIAQNHPDAYIRQRAAVNLGQTTSFPPLPTADA